MSFVSDLSEFSSYIYSRDDLDDPLHIAGIGPAIGSIQKQELDTGFYAEARQLNGKTVIAFRGTDFNARNNLDWTQGNIPVALGDRKIFRAVNGRPLKAL